MMDITKDEVQEVGKRNVLEKVEKTLKELGINPAEYNLYLHKKTQVKSAPNIQVYQTAAYLAATSLSPSAAKIFLYFLSQSEFENFVGIDQKTLSENIDMPLRSVNSAVRELAENGIIIKSKSNTDKRRNDYWLNPMSAWKGKTLNRKLALQKLNTENSNQLHLFGETYEENVIREAQEIKAKRPNLFLTGGK